MSIAQQPHDYLLPGGVGVQTEYDLKENDTRFTFTKIIRGQPFRYSELQREATQHQLIRNANHAFALEENKSVMESHPPEDIYLIPITREDMRVKWQSGRAPEDVIKLTDLVDQIAEGLYAETK